jgi:hypothetical protein
VELKFVIRIKGEGKAAYLSGCRLNNMAQLEYKSVLVVIAGGQQNSQFCLNRTVLWTQQSLKVTPELALENV